MNKYLIVLGFLSLLLACDQTTAVKEINLQHDLLPHPKIMSTSDKGLVLSDASKLYSPNSELYPLLELFALELEKTTGTLLQTTTQKNSEADIIFSIDTTLAQEEYIIHTTQSIQISGGSYTAVAMARTTLLQLAHQESGELIFPIASISDSPDATYRGLMIDLARKWHTMGTVKKLVDLAAFYKLNYVQLHFTDYQSYTLPSERYPKLSTPDRHYSFEELRELETYSQLRGVTIIPEVDIPGHSSPFVKMYPEIFAIEDTASNPWIINMGKEEVYEAMDVIIGELVQIFQATPYFHIGGDEAIFHKVDEDPDVQAYMKQNELGEDVHELYRHFLVRMNEVVKKHGKQMCVWEGFGPEGEVEIPKDIIVFEFETNRYLPNLLVEDGYTVVNTSWKPLYVVNQKKWEPKTIYQWNMWRWENWWDQAPSFEPIQVEQSPLIIGAQMCAWEQTEEVEIPSLRKRIPAFVERVWNTEEQISYEQLITRMDRLDERLSLLIDDDRQDSLLIDYNFEK